MLVFVPTLLYILEYSSVMFTFHMYKNYVLIFP